MKLFVISVDDRPGMIAEICDLVKPAKIKYLATQKADYGRGFIKIITDGDESTEKKLVEKKFMFIKEPLILFKTDGSSEALYMIAHGLGSKGINIENMFALDSNTLAMIVAPNDVDRVHAILKGKEI